MAQGITIVVEEGKDVSIEMHGYQGEACQGDYQKFLKMLEEQGLQVVDRKERRKSEVVSTAIRQGVSN